MKPERDENREPFIRDNWWIFGRPRPELRAPLKGLPRYISTVETAKAPTLEGFLEEAPIAAVRRKQPWPATLPEQVRGIKEVLRSSPAQTPQQVASAFKPAPRTRVAEILETLTALGQVRDDDGRFSL